MLTNGRILFFYTDGREFAQDFDKLELTPGYALAKQGESATMTALAGVREIRILLRG
jgi:hypothetical protein